MKESELTRRMRTEQLVHTRYQLPNGNYRYMVLKPHAGEAEWVGEEKPTTGEAIRASGIDTMKSTSLDNDLFEAEVERRKMR